MPATQTNALNFNPNQLALTNIATYRRTIKASIERVWENVLDWEHLPHLHDTSFNYVDLDDAGDWGWRTWSDDRRQGHIELCVDETQYVARSYRNGEQFSEIWTYLNPVAGYTDIRVEFWGTDVNPAKKEQLGSLYTELYTQLWDEDEAMMIERERRLREPKSTETEINLGPKSSLQFPYRFKLKGKEFLLKEKNDCLNVQPTICPHLLGPLSEQEDGTLLCPWHGYRFDSQSGECLSPANANCKLGSTPLIRTTSDNIIISYN